jgi:hypothetical protein
VNLLNTLGTRFKAADAQHFAIFKGMLTVALFTLLGKLMSAAKEMVVAYRYGLSAEVDAYQFLYNLLSWPIGIWCSVLTAVLVPLAVRLREHDKDQVPHFRAELFGLALLLGSGLALLAWLGLRTMLGLGKSGLPAHSVQLAQAALPGLIFVLPLGILVALQSAWMLSAVRTAPNGKADLLDRRRIGRRPRRTIGQCAVAGRLGTHARAGKNGSWRRCILPRPRRAVPLG